MASLKRGLENVLRELCAMETEASAFTDLVELAVKQARAVKELAAKHNLKD